MNLKISITPRPREAPIGMHSKSGAKFFALLVGPRAACSRGVPFDECALLTDDEVEGKIDESAFAEYKESRLNRAKRIIFIQSRACLYTC